MATHSSVLAWRIPGTGEPGGLLSMGSHRVGHDWGNLAAVAAVFHCIRTMYIYSVCVCVCIRTHTYIWRKRQNPDKEGPQRDAEPLPSPTFSQMPWGPTLPFLRPRLPGIVRRRTMGVSSSDIRKWWVKDLRQNGTRWKSIIVLIILGFDWIQIPGERICFS